MSFWKTKHFKALQKAWYQRLEDEGFLDAEVLIGDQLALKQTAAQIFRWVDEGSAANKADYFHAIAQKVQETAFSNDIDRLILSRHAEGAKIRHIVEELESNGYPRCRFTVRIKIRTYEMAWGLRQYTPKQLNRKAG